MGINVVWDDQQTILRWDFEPVYRVNTWRTATTLEDARNLIAQDRTRSGS